MRLIIASITAFIYTILAFYFSVFNLIPLFILFIVVCIASYAIINYSFEKFIYEKIKIIYKTIGSLKTQKKQELKKKSKSDDVLDIVNQVVLEWDKEKKQEIEELKKMAVYRREFLGNVSHELKTPIFNIQGYVLSLLDGGIEDPDINQKFLNKAEKSVNRMIAIVEDLEEINKLESGELKIKKENFDLIELTKEVMDFMEMKAETFNSKIQIKSIFPHC